VFTEFVEILFKRGDTPEPVGYRTDYILPLIFKEMDCKNECAVTDTTHTGEQPTAGFNRPTILFVIWVGIALVITALATLDLVQEGVEDAWIFLLSGVMLLWFIIRDWFRHEGGAFVRRDNDLPFLGVTVFMLAVTLWVLSEQFVI